MSDLTLPTPTPQQVRELRLKYGLSQSEFAELAGLHNHHRVSDIERGAVKMSPHRWSMVLLGAGEHPNYEITAKRP